ncbi:hypothetical protein ANAPC4_00837 [Anaplasma phagocytophilum]|nr:hypothetical protein ANAPC4_00837 [Anaplasma phagocytophilum]
MRVNGRLAIGTGMAESREVKQEVFISFLLEKGLGAMVAREFLKKLRS